MDNHGDAHVHINGHDHDHDHDHKHEHKHEHEALVHDAHDHHDEKPLPAHDRNLSSLHLFWYTFWSSIAEAIYLIIMIITQTVISSFVSEEEEHANKEHLQSARVGASESHESAVSAEEATWAFLLYTLPSCAIILSATILFASRRDRYILRKAHFVVMILAILAGLAGFGYSMRHYVSEFKGEDCEEFEGWSAPTLRVLFVILTLCPLFLRIGLARTLRADLALARTLDADLGLTPVTASAPSISIFAEPPKLGGWKTAIKIANAIIMLCCMPKQCHDIKDEHAQHVAQHVMQLIYEIVLLILACVEHKYIELIAIVAGLVGSLVGLAHAYMLDLIINLFALIAGLFLFANSIARFNCHDSSNLEDWVYLLCFSLIATSIRFKSLMHAFVEGREQVYHWIIAQLPSVLQTNFAQDSFARIVNFGTILNYPAHPHHDTKKISVNTPLLPKKRSVNGTGRKANPLLVCAVCVLLLGGLALAITFASLMGVFFPKYRGGNQVAKFQSWTDAQCNISSLEYITNPKPDHVYDNFGIYIWQANATSNPASFITGVSITSRFSHDSTGEDHSDKTYFNAYYGRYSVPCRVPPNPLSWQDSTRLDWNRKAKEWQQVAIFGTGSDLAAYKKGYYLWILLPVFMMALGVAGFIASIVLLVKDARKHRKTLT